MNYAAASSRYSLFTPMEAAIIFHFAGRGGGTSRLALVDFAQLLNPRWKTPQSQFQEEKKDKKTSLLTETLRSAYNFALGGLAGAIGATIVYPIDLVKVRYRVTVELRFAC